MVLVAFLAAAASKLTLAVVAEGHLGLTKANRVLPRSNAIELLQLGLLDTLAVSC